MEKTKAKNQRTKYNKGGIMKKNNYFYQNKQGRNIILSITSTYIELTAPDGYFYLTGKFNNEVQELARKIIPDKIGNLIQENKEIVANVLKRIGKEDFSVEKILLKGDNEVEVIKIIAALKKVQWFNHLEIVLADIDKNMTYLRKKESGNSYSSELQLFDDESKYFDVISDKSKSDIYSEETEIFRKIEGILG